MDENVVWHSNCSLYTKDNECKSALHYAKDAGTCNQCSNKYIYIYIYIYIFSNIYRFII